MKPAQGSITAAYIVVAATLAAEHGWTTTAKTWITKAPGTTSTPQRQQSVAGIPDWQAGIATYLIFMLIGESDDFGPVAAALAWALAISLVLRLSTDFKNLVPGATPAAQPTGPQITGPAPGTPQNPASNAA